MVQGEIGANILPLHLHAKGQEMLISRVKLSYNLQSFAQTEFVTICSKAKDIRTMPLLSYYANRIHAKSFYKVAYNPIESAMSSLDCSLKYDVGKQ
jgi:hypothetical protein